VSFIRKKDSKAFHKKSLIDLMMVVNMKTRVCSQRNMLMYTCARSPVWTDFIHPLKITDQKRKSWRICNSIQMF